MTTGVGSAYRTLAIHDLDGSVTGIPNSYVLLNDGENDSVATDDTCQIHPTWNASVCTGDIGRLYLRAAVARIWRLRRSRRRRTARFAISARRRSWRSGPARSPWCRSLRLVSGPRSAELPIALVRNGKEFHITGNQSTVRAGTEIQVKTERPKVSLSLSEMDKGSWVMFELPGFTNAASGTKQDSMDALRKASETSYFKDKDALWVKLVVAEPPVMPIRPMDMQASITVSR